VKMPALQDRGEDIQMLARHFVQKCARKCNMDPRPISREAMDCLMNYDWPGNVRELENAIEHALLLGDSDMILREDLPESLLERPSAPESTEAKYSLAVKEFKKQLILNAMEQARGNYTEAAHVLGVHPNYLHRLIRQLELKKILKERYPRGPSGPPGEDD
jgi:DNA-binding NtrC family response regulator